MSAWLVGLNVAAMVIVLLMAAVEDNPRVRYWQLVTCGWIGMTIMWGLP